MLVLSRKAGQSVVIGNSIRLTVVELSSGTVRLGFEAPADVSIYREEIHLEIARANREALGLPTAGEDAAEPQRADRVVPDDDESESRS